MSTLALGPEVGMLAQPARQPRTTESKPWDTNFRVRPTNARPPLRLVPIHRSRQCVQWITDASDSKRLIRYVFHAESIVSGLSALYMMVEGCPDPVEYGPDGHVAAAPRWIALIRRFAPETSASAGSDGSVRVRWLSALCRLARTKGWDFLESSAWPHYPSRLEGYYSDLKKGHFPC